MNQRQPRARVRNKGEGDKEAAIIEEEKISSMVDE